MSGTILVSGATGNQGGAAARSLLAAGFDVRAITRNPDKPEARALSDLGAEVVRGDLDDYDPMRRAVEGVYGVFSTQQYFEAGYDGEVRQGKALADAAKEAGAEHFVYTSVATAERGTGIPHFESKSEIEDHVRESGLRYTILRPVSFMQNWEWMRGQIFEGSIAQPLDPDKPMQQIAAEDIGAFATKAFENPELWIGREVEIAGDETTMTEAAELFSRITSRKVEYFQTPWEEFGKSVPDEISLMYRWLDEAGGEADIPALRTEYPSLATFEHYLRTHGWETLDPAKPQIRPPGEPMKLES